jgi:NADH-quinone oxidoreductase subunit K
MKTSLILILVLVLSGIGGIILYRTNLLLIIMCLEILFFSISLNFVLFSYFLDDVLGEVFFLYILTVAGAESGVGLAILVAYYRLRGEVWLDMINRLKG